MGVRFSYRYDDWVTQTHTGAISYEIIYDPVKGRWYLDASWTAPVKEQPTLRELQCNSVVGVDLNADHITAAVITSDGNIVGEVHRYDFDNTGAAGVRQASLADAIKQVVLLAQHHNCSAIAIEDLSFNLAGSKQQYGSSKKMRTFRGKVSGLPTRQFVSLLNGMCHRGGLWVTVVDPAYTSVCGKKFWVPVLKSRSRNDSEVTVHHGAAVAIGRRGVSHKLTNRFGVGGSVSDTVAEQSIGDRGSDIDVSVVGTDGVTSDCVVGGELCGFGLHGLSSDLVGCGAGSFGTNHSVES